MYATDEVGVELCPGEVDDAPVTGVDVVAADPVELRGLVVDAGLELVPCPAVVESEGSDPWIVEEER